MKETVLGVDLGLNMLISTSAFYGFGDVALRGAFHENNGAEDWIKKQIEAGSGWLFSLANKMRSNIIAIENLRIEGLKAKANEKMALSAIVEQIKKDSMRLSVRVETVDPAYTSMMCSNCGKLASGRREGGSFYCSYCELVEDADVNAAKNIGIIYIIGRAIRNLRVGKKLLKSYYLSTSGGPRSIDDLSWVRDRVTRSFQRASV